LSEIEQSAADVIDNLALFRRAVLGGGHFYRTVLRDAWTETN